MKKKTEESSTEDLTQNKELEKKFRKALKEAHKLIDVHLKDVASALKKAEEVSEKFGIPFQSSISDVRSRNYVPRSFHKIWGYDEDDMLCNVLEEESDYAYYTISLDNGWEYWNTSSLNC